MYTSNLFPGPPCSKMTMEDEELCLNSLITTLDIEEEKESSRPLRNIRNHIAYFDNGIKDGGKNDKDKNYLR
jgi:hypothetical protein